MATSVISNVITDPSGTAISGVVTIARLKPLGFRTSDSSEIAPQVSTATNSAGEWSLTLEEQANITPAGTFWEIEEQIPEDSGGRKVWTISVGASNATLDASRITPSLDTSFLTYITQAAGDARYQPIGAGASNLHWVSGTDYGMSTGATDNLSAFLLAAAAAGTDGVLVIPPGSYNFSADPALAIDGINVLQFGVIFVQTYSGKWTWGSSSRHYRIRLYGGKVKKSGTLSWPAGSVGVRFRNLDYSGWYGGFDIIGFERGFQFYADNGQGCSYNTVEPASILSCKWMMSWLADGADAFCNENMAIGKWSASWSTTDPNANGGACLEFDAINGADAVFDNNGNAAFGVSMENPGVVNGNPAQFVYCNAQQTKIYGRCEGTTTTGKSVVEGPASTAGGNVYELEGAQANMQHVSQQSGRGKIWGYSNNYIGGGDGVNPVLTIRDISSVANDLVVVLGTDGSTKWLVISAVGELIVGNGGARMKRKLAGTISWASAITIASASVFSITVSVPNTVLGDCATGGGLAYALPDKCVQNFRCIAAGVRVEFTNTSGGDVVPTAGSTLRALVEQY